MGSIRKQGITNTIISYVGVCIGFLNLLVLQPFMLKPEELGLTRMLYSATLLIGTIFPVGLNFLTIRFFPKFKNNENGHNGYLGLLFILALSGYVIIATLVLLGKNLILMRYDNSPLFSQYFYFVFPISLCIGLTSLLTAYCNALFKSTVPTFLNEIYLRLFMTVLVVVYYLQLISFPVFVILFAGAYAIQLFSLIGYIRFIGALRLKTNWSFFRKQPLREIAKYTLLLAFASIAAIGIRNIDVMMVGSYLTLDAVAVYSLGMTIGSLIEVPVNSLGRIADAKISDAIQRNDMRLVKEVYGKSVEYLLLFGGLLFVLLYANVDEAISFLPAKYHQARNVVLIISFSALINMATGVNTSIIYFSSKYVIGTYLLFAMILLSVVLNTIFLPLYGIEGSALATAIAMTLYNIAKFFLIRNHFQLQPYNAHIAKIVVVIVLSFLAAIFFPAFENKIISIIVKTVCITAIFGGLLLATKVYSASTLLSFKKTFF
jgi:O-antigen/teichoic acid export membrane protein